ncbi:hypothetical protein JB92DRAFT_2860194 [Gautieria morchelliformis]|nr:hypothetical protein JB92DRAFT_2860194 [Gautieria morchelliformis]
MNSLSTANLVSSSAPASFPPFFRRRTLGRAPSPPTWACYEQIPPPASDSDECDSDVQTDTDTQSGSDSEAEDEYVKDRHLRSGPPSGDMEMEMQVGQPEPLRGAGMELDGARVEGLGQGDPGAENACGSAGEQCNDDDCDQRLKRQDKGKQRAVEPELETLPVEKSAKKRHRKRKHHETPFTYRPILTIKKSEGFVWNQDLFVPSYIKDRYVASTSPPSSGFTANTPISVSVPASELNDSYEVEVVEIRVQGNELDGIIS